MQIGENEMNTLYVLKHKKAIFSKNGIQKALLYHKKVLPLKAINLVNKNIEP